jgi:hypothetical protein
MDERRNEGRRRVLKAAKIVFNSRQSVLDCYVRDVSDSGARLEFKALTVFPDTFELLIGSETTFRKCQVAWRSNNAAGVTFTQCLRRLFEAP